jgi:hypothetical protein
VTDAPNTTRAVPAPGSASSAVSSRDVQ